MVDGVLVLALLAIAVRVGTPLLTHWWYERQAAEVVKTVRQVYDAALEARTLDGVDALRGAPLGEIPTGLAPHLPPGTAFRTPGVALDWSWWTFGEVLDPLVEGDGVGTLTVHIDHPRVRDAFRRLAWRSVWLDTGTELAFLLPLEEE